MTLLELLSSTHTPLAVQIVLPFLAGILMYEYTLKSRTLFSSLRSHIDYLFSVFWFWFVVGVLVNGWFTLL